MEQRFEAVQREAQAAGGSGREAVQEHSGPSGYRWQRSYSRNGPGEAGVAAGCLGQRALGEGFLPSVPPPGGAACLGAPQLSQWGGMHPAACPCRLPRVPLRELFSDRGAASRPLRHGARAATRCRALGPPERPGAAAGGCPGRWVCLLGGARAVLPLTCSVTARSWQASLVSHWSAPAGFWAAATAAFNRRYGLTTYREESRWRLLLLWPLLLLTSPEFREQFWAAVRHGRRSAGGGGHTFAAGGKQA